MAIRPTEEEKSLGKEYGWSDHAIETGYEIFTFCGCDFPYELAPLNIEAVCDMGTFERFYSENKEQIPDDVGVDDLAALQAMEDGYCKIIPIEELPEKLIDKYKFFGWVDTTENREKLEKLSKYFDGGNANEDLSQM